MATIISVLLLLVAGGLALPCAADILAVLRPRGRASAGVAADTAPPMILFLVPAHDEELLIPRCLRSIQALAYPKDRFDLLVVADNCTDGTAEVARRLGAHCVERTDPILRGKPRALAWAFGQIDLDACDAIVVLDADSILDPGYAAALAGRSPLREKVIQGYNDVSNPCESYLTRMASVFSAARALGMNEVKQRAGLNSPLSNGFCIGADVLRRHGWPAFSLTEDWELYAILTARGVALENEPRARVFCQEARSLKESGSQRRRWSAGKITVLLTRAPAMVRSRTIGLLQKLDGVAELLAPGPTVALVVAVAVAAGALASSVPAAGWIAALAALSVARMGVYTLLGLSRVDEPGKAAAAFLILPFYAVWRLGVQFSALVTMVRGTWVRTARHQEANQGG